MPTLERGRRARPYFQAGPMFVKKGKKIALVIEVGIIGRAYSLERSKVFEGLYIFETTLQDQNSLAF